MRVIFVIFAMLCFVISCDNETEIIQMSNITHVYRLIYDDRMGKSEHFVITNHPHNKDSLLRLVSKHFQSFSPNDTIERYYYYHHSYFKETKYTPRDYKETSRNLIEDHRKDLLVKIVISTSYNKKEIIFYKKEKPETEIKSSWK